MKYKIKMIKAYIRTKLPIIYVKNNFLRRFLKSICGVFILIRNIPLCIRVIFKDYLVIPQVDYVITTRCSLKCKECADLMPLFKCPINYDAEVLNSNVDELMNVVDKIGELRVLGGEPFVHPELTQILEHVVDNSKIEKIVIFTNGTICPKDNQLVQVLKNRKISIEISDYGELSRNKKKLMELCKKEKIKCCINFIPEWESFGDLKYRNRTKKELEKQFSNCNNACRAYLEGKFYFCERAASGTVLGYIANGEKDAVNIISRELSKADKRKEIVELCYEARSIEACQYCDKGTSECKIVPIAEQIK